jgi:hypothetical protein
MQYEQDRPVSLDGSNDQILRCFQHIDPDQRDIPPETDNLYGRSRDGWRKRADRIASMMGKVTAIQGFRPEFTWS